jgi:hypothetical protein
MVGLGGLRSERGSVLLACLVLVAIITLLGGALFDLATLEGRLAYWDALSSGALYCAEGGAARALATILQAPVAALLWHDTDQTLASPPFGTCTYRVLYANAAANPRTLTSTGTIRGESRTVRHTGQHFAIKDALLADGNLSISGNPPVGGACGNVHANENLSVSGNPTVAGDATASGTATGNVPAGSGGRPPHAAPAIDPRRFLTSALQPDAKRSDGTALPPTEVFRLIPVPPTFATAVVTDGTGAVIPGCCTPGQTFRGWKYNSSGPEWDYDTPTPHDGTYYIEGYVKMSKDVGTALAPWRITVLAAPPGLLAAPSPPAAGSSINDQLAGDLGKVSNIEVSGNPKMIAHFQHTLLVAGRDLKLNGNASQNFAEGIIAAHEQIQISGNPPIAGAVYAEDGGAVSSMVTINEVSGNASITYNCGLTLNIDCWPEAGCRRWEEVRN